MIFLWFFCDFRRINLPAVIFFGYSFPWDDSITGGSHLFQAFFLMRWLHRRTSHLFRALFPTRWLNHPKQSSFSGIISQEMIQPPNQSSLSDNIPQRDDSAFLKKENHPHSAQTIKTSNKNQAIKQPPPPLTKHFERERRGGCPLSLFRVFFCVRRGVEAKSMTFRELPPRKSIRWR